MIYMKFYLITIYNEYLRYYFIVTKLVIMRKVEFEFTTCLSSLYHAWAYKKLVQFSNCILFLFNLLSQCQGTIFYFAILCSSNHLRIAASIRLVLIPWIWPFLSVYIKAYIMPMDAEPNVTSTFEKARCFAYILIIGNIILYYSKHTTAQ